MWLKRDRSLCDGCGELLTPFYAIPEKNELFFCPECQAKDAAAEGNPG